VLHVQFCIHVSWSLDVARRESGEKNITYIRMYQQEIDDPTPHESIVTQDATGGEFGISFQDMSALSNPTAYPELDFHLQQVDVTGSNYFTYHTDPSTQLGAPSTEMLSIQQDFAYQQQQHLTNMNMYGSLGSESSGFVPGVMEGYNTTNTNGNINLGQFESTQVVVSSGRRERQRGSGGSGGGGHGKGIEKKEKQRRERLGEKYEMLKALIPNRTKDDRATIVSDAIDYINELCRTVNELKLLVEKKRLKYCTSASFNNKLDTESSSIIPTVPTPDHHGIQFNLNIIHLIIYVSVVYSIQVSISKTTN
jgi:Helix-loop-helix DNA-binding domain